MQYVMTLRGRKIRIDKNGLVSLNDIHKAAGFTKNHRPSDWTRLQTTLKDISAVLKRTTGKSRRYTKNEIKSVLYTSKNANEGTWAHENLALAYAAYLSRDLATEIRDVFLRYKKADPKLADEILENATPEDNEWAGKRALSRSRRKEFTSVLNDHGVKGVGYGTVTNATYGALFDKTAKQIRSSRKLPKSMATRDSFSNDELVAVMFAETLSAQRIEQEDSQGNSECTVATSRSSKIVRSAIDENRKDQQPRLTV